MDNTPVTAIVLRIAALGTSKEGFARRAQSLADAQLALPDAKDVLLKIDLYFPNEMLRDVLRLPPVCVLTCYKFASDEARLKLIAHPEYSRLSGQFDPLGSKTAFPVQLTTYTDQPALRSGPTMTGVSILNIPATADNFAGVAQPAGDLHQKLKPAIENFLALPEVQRGLAKCTVMQMSQTHSVAPRAILESAINNVLTRNQSTIVLLGEAADFTEIAQSPAVLSIINDVRETMPAFESISFIADVIKKTGF